LEEVRKYTAIQVKERKKKKFLTDVTSNQDCKMLSPHGAAAPWQSAAGICCLASWEDKLSII